MEINMFSSFLFLVIPIFVFLMKKGSRKLPPGSMGLPVIGHSIGLLRAMRANKGEEWLQHRINKYGPISKLNLFGKPSIFLSGQAANKFIYMSDDSTLSNKQPASVRRILGERNILELTGEEHKRVRGAFVSFLKPEVLKRYVYKIDEEVREHLEIHWHGSNEEVKVAPLMETLTFNIICSLIIGLEKGTRRDLLKDLFKQVIDGIYSVPVNLPFTRFSRSLKARKRMVIVLSELISEKREALQTHGAFSHQDLITCLLNSNREGESAVISDDEILDNVIAIMLAGHDAPAVLLTSLIRIFSMKPSIHAAVVEEELANSKPSSELLTWDDLVKMKYTWKVAMESLRMIPPTFISFRQAVRDIKYDRYIIPKGWQVVWGLTMTHLDETIFKDPAEFDDKRFEQQPPPYSFAAFGGGPRICPGYELAKMETLVFIHYLVTRFKWQLATDDTSYVRNPLPVFKHDLPVRIIPK